MVMSRPVVAGNNADGLPGADPGADVALQAQNLVQAQLHRIDEQRQRQFQLRLGFAFDHPGFHVMFTRLYEWFTQLYVRILSTVAAGFSLRQHRLKACATKDFISWCPSRSL